MKTTFGGAATEKELRKTKRVRIRRIVLNVWQKEQE
jgi:hypothetical protein